MVLPQPALRQGGREEAAFVRDAEQGGGFQGLDESGRVTDRKDVPDPLMRIASRDEGHDAGRSDLGILRPELRLGFGVGLEPRAVDVTAVDAARVLDLPRPARAHRLRGRVGQEGLIGPRPTTNHGFVAEQRIGVADERRAEGLADQLGAEAGGVYEEIRRQPLPVLQPKGLDLPIGLLDRGQVAVDDFDAELGGMGLQPSDEFRVLDVVAHRWVHQGPGAFRATRKDLTGRHQRGHGVDVGQALAAGEADRSA